MTQRPAGEVVLVDKQGRHPVPFADHDLYARSLGLFSKAAAGAGRPAADGVDGVKSLAVALAVREAARRGRAVRVNYGGF
jgi:1,5-anhydro-D-fructose reductase (1,5-anhydro-D-mannitol-forming)